VNDAMSRYEAIMRQCGMVPGSKKNINAEGDDINEE
jgi:hypothetical protein